MRGKLFLLMAAVLICGQARTDFKVLGKAYEVPLNELTLPASISGTVSFRECENCERLTIRISANTRFLINEQSVTLAEFKTAVRSTRNATDKTITVLHDFRSDTVTELSKSL